MVKKVFFLVNSLEMGGAERVIINLSKELKKDYNIKIITLKKQSFYESTVKTESLVNTKSNLGMMLFFPLSVIRLKNKIKKEKPLKVISFLELSNFANILANKNAVISLRISLPFFKGLKGKIYFALIKILYPKSKLIITNSEENRQDVVSVLNVKKKRTKTIMNPVDTRSAERTSKETPEDEYIKRIRGKTIFISVGRFERKKRFPELIKAFKIIAKKNPESLLVIIGSGKEKEKIEKTIKEEKLEKNIYLAGRKKNVYKHLSRADYFIYASKYEGLPNTIIEAITMKLPVITTDFKTGARELIDPVLDLHKEIQYPYYGPNGVLLSIENFEEDLKKALPWISKLKQEKKGFEKLEIDNVIKKWKEIIEEKY